MFGGNGFLENNKRGHLRSACRISGLVIVFWFAVAPFLTLLHELGHSVVPLLNGETVEIRIGGSAGPRLDLGILTLEYGGPWQPWAGFADWSGETTNLKLALGPLTSLALAVGLFYFLKISRSRSVLLKGAVAYSAAAFLVSAFPFNYPSLLIDSPIPVSDGKQILDRISQSKPHSD